MMNRVLEAVSYMFISIKRLTFQKSMESHGSLSTLTGCLIIDAQISFVSLLEQAVISSLHHFVSLLNVIKHDAVF